VLTHFSGRYGGGGEQPALPNSEAARMQQDVDCDAWALRQLRAEAMAAAGPCCPPVACAFDGFTWRVAPQGARESQEWVPGWVQKASMQAAPSGQSGGRPFWGSRGPQERGRSGGALGREFVARRGEQGSRGGALRHWECDARVPVGGKGLPFDGDVDSHPGYRGRGARARGIPGQLGTGRVGYARCSLLVLDMRTIRWSLGGIVRVMMKWTFRALVFRMVWCRMARRVCGPMTLRQLY
jgi:hypothetical protein